MKEILNYRYYVLAVLVGVGFTCLLADVEADAEFGRWIAYQVAYKFVAIVCLMLAYRLINKWNPEGKIDAFAKIEKFTTKLIDQ